jgi:hypothetical protein
MVGGPDLDFLTIGALKGDGTAAAHGLINHIAFREDLIAGPQGHRTSFDHVDQVAESRDHTCSSDSEQIQSNKI